MKIINKTKWSNKDIENLVVTIVRIIRGRLPSVVNVRWSAETTYAYGDLSNKMFLVIARNQQISPIASLSTRRMVSNTAYLRLCAEITHHTMINENKESTLIRSAYDTENIIALYQNLCIVPQ